MKTENKKRQRVELTDSFCVAIVEDYRQQIGDKTSAKTLGRIVQAFHAMGGQLGPVATQTPEGQGVGIAAPTPSVTQPS